jgi:RimJ/RimL family protein N-acetyltransferase
MEQRAHLAEHWPLFGLSIRTPRLELRYPDDEDLIALSVAATDIQEPGGVQPFSIAWHLGPEDEVRTRFLQHHWARRGDWAPDTWNLTLAAVVDGEVVGVQALHPVHPFTVSRTLASGSWLTRAFQGRGVGTEMRHAILHLAFEGLGAVRAETGAIEGNAPSLAVTEKLGYRPNGDGVNVDGDTRRRELRFVMDRADWETRRRDDIEVIGLEPCLPLFGLGSPSGDGVA